MAEITRYENLAALSTGDTITGSAYVYFMVVGGSQTATLTVSLSTGGEIRIKARTDETVSTPECIHIGKGTTATINLSGPASRAYAIFEVE